ncbi:MAG: carboxypeptidase regulatory-like domain-containing protein [Saprospiraceae bacterium]|nr:carboxypeptidase regulatory-like domain-containing protein [Saprospiraceae bacterium]
MNLFISITKCVKLACIAIMASLLAFSCTEDTIKPDVFGSLSGQVLIEGTSIPVADAIVSTNPPTSQVLTDATGRFVFDEIETGTYAIRAEKTGLSSASETVTIVEDKESAVIISMSEKTVENTPPTAPEAIQPLSGATNLGTTILLKWTSTDADEDTLSFDVYTYHSAQGAGLLVAEGITDTTFQLTNVKYGTTCFWQVVANDGENEPVFSEVWGFTTQDFPAHPFVFAKIANGKFDVFAAQNANVNTPIYQLSNLPGSSFRPRISPLGDKVAFLNNNFINTQIYVMKRDGTDPELVPTTVPIDGSDMFQLDFCWSPDGTKLLFMNKNRLYKTNLDGSGLALFAELPVGEEFVEVDWAPVTNKIAARTVGNQPYIGKILLYSESGTLEQTLVADLPGNIGGPAFSVDGSSILYTHDIDGLETSDGRQLNAHIFLKNIASGTTTDLSVDKPAGFNDLDPKFSPNGAQVIFVETSNAPNSPKNISLMNGMGQGRLTMFQNAEMPDWK